MSRDSKWDVKKEDAPSMARAAELVDLIAALTAIDHATVTRHARFVREAGYLSQSGRGLSAAHMTAGDAAHLLVAILNNGIAQDAATVLKHIGNMDVFTADVDKVQENDSPDMLARLRGILPVLLDREHTFVEMLTGVIELAAQNPAMFEERTRNSSIYFDCDDYQALVYFDINLADVPMIGEHQTSFQYSYSHPTLQPKSQHFKRSTQLDFTGIARVGELIARK